MTEALTLLALNHCAVTRDSRMRICRWLLSNRELPLPIANDQWHEACGRAAIQWPTLAAMHGFVLSIADEDYPSRLKEIEDPPPVLIGRGQRRCLRSRPIAIVGSRRASHAALFVAEQFARQCATENLLVVSGLARGVDTAAHRGALSHPLAQTVAILGCGVEQVYPAANRALAADILERGVLLSEFPLGTPPKAAHFPQRNRIISGMADAVLIVEASERSGSLITARFAAEQGREVLVVPGLITDDRNGGGHRLIREGACLVRSVEDVFESLGITSSQSVANAADRAPQLSAQSVALLTQLQVEPMTLDEIAQRVPWPPERIAAYLVQLELDGMVLHTPHGYIRRPA